LSEDLIIQISKVQRAKETVKGARAHEGDSGRCNGCDVCICPYSWVSPSRIIICSCKTGA